MRFKKRSYVAPPCINYFNNEEIYMTYFRPKTKVCVHLSWTGLVEFDLTHFYVQIQTYICIAPGILD